MRENPAFFRFIKNKLDFFNAPWFGLIRCYSIPGKLCSAKALEDEGQRMGDGAQGMMAHHGFHGLVQRKRGLPVEKGILLGLLLEGVRAHPAQWEGR